MQDSPRYRGRGWWRIAIQEAAVLLVLVHGAQKAHAIESRALWEWEWGLGVSEGKGLRTGGCQRALVALRTGSRVPLVVVVPDIAVRALLALAPLALVRCAGVPCTP